MSEENKQEEQEFEPFRPETPLDNMTKKDRIRALVIAIFLLIVCFLKLASMGLF